jgi:hypothetical protein
MERVQEESIYLKSRFAPGEYNEPVTTNVSGPCIEYRIGETVG